MDRIYVITGATSGIGLELARQLARAGDVRLIVGARKPKAAYELRAAVPAGQLTLLPLDLADLASVREFAKGVAQALPPGRAIAGLACNAGLLLAGPRQLTPDGVEVTFAANHLGHFLLVHQLLPLLAPGAVVTATASLAHNREDPLADTVGSRGGFFPSAEAVAVGQLDAGVGLTQQNMDRYATSKLCNLLTTFEMARRVPASTARFIAFDPGLVTGTSLVRDRSLPIRFGWSYVLPLFSFASDDFSTAERSAAALAKLLQGTTVEARTGAYYDVRLQPARISQDALRTDWARDLYEHSARLSGIPGYGARQPATHGF